MNELQKQRKIGQLILLVRILKTIAETEEMGLFSRIRPEMLAEWMEGDQDTVDELIETYRGLMVKQVYVDTWSYIKRQHEDLESDYLSFALRGRKTYICYLIENKTEECGKFAAKIVDSYCRANDCVRELPYRNTAFARSILQTYADTLAGRIADGAVRFGEDVVYEIVKSYLSEGAVHKLAVIGSGEERQ